MKLITKEIEKRFKEVGSQEKIYNPLVIAKFFNPSGAGTWYATEYNSKSKVFFGYVSIYGDHNDEWGSFSLEELEDFKGLFGMGIERDMYCGEANISDFDTRALRFKKTKDYEQDESKGGL